MIVNEQSIEAPGPEHMHAGRFRRCGLVAALILGFACQRAAGDLVELKDGQSFTGRILADTGTSIRLKTGNSLGPRELEISVSEIKTTRRFAEEVEEINRCADAMTAVRWGQGYFQADLTSLADQCIARALALDSTLQEKPLVEGSEPYVRFWNERVFRIRSNAASSNDARALFELAKWAHAAGLVDHARETLRFAWQANPRAAEIERLAGEWGVLLQGTGSA